MSFLALQEFSLKGAGLLLYELRLGAQCILHSLPPYRLGHPSDSLHASGNIMAIVRIGVYYQSPTLVVNVRSLEGIDRPCAPSTNPMVSLSDFSC